jgi:acyl-CoA synthetase (AMP-forming)/AMP-acid ligase II
VLSTIRGGRARRAATAEEAGKPAVPNLVPVSLSLWAGIYQVLFAFRAGNPVVIMERFEPAEFVRLVQSFQIRSTVLPPAAMTMLCDADTVTDLSPLRFVRSITAPLSAFQARRFRDQFGISILNCYGQTEIGGEIVGWSAADSRAFGDTKLGAVGRPHTGVEIRVIDEDGHDVTAAGGEGEICVMTPALSAGYADGGDLRDRLTPDGWFRTGDVGRLDDDGFLWIDGRVSDMINRGGLKVFPAEVEEVLRLAPDDKEFLRHNKLDLTVLLLTVPLLPGVLQALWVLRLLRLIDMMPAVLGRFVNITLLPYAVVLAFIAVFGGGLAFSRL